MVHDDEVSLMNTLRERGKAGTLPYVRGIVGELGIDPKRAAYILQKWESKSWYEYGTSVMAGWLTESGGKAILR